MVYFVKRFWRYTLIFFVLFLISCQKSKPDMRIGIHPWPGYEILYLANELGYFDDASFNIEFVELDTPNDELHAFIRGDTNARFTTLVELLTTYENFGKITKIIAITDFSEGSDVILAKKGINSIKDLKGKRVACEKASTPVYLLGRALEFASIDVEEIIHVGIEHDRFYAAMEKDEIDVAVSYPPFSTKLENSFDLNVIFTSSQIPAEIIDVISVSPSLLEKVPDIQSQVMKAWDKGLRYMIEKSEKAYLMVAQREGITVKEVKESYQGIKLMYSNKQLEYFPPQSQKLSETLKRANNILIKTGSVKKEIPIESFLKRENKK